VGSAFAGRRSCLRNGLRLFFRRGPADLRRQKHLAQLAHRSPPGEPARHPLDFRQDLGSGVRGRTGERHLSQRWKIVHVVAHESGLAARNGEICRDALDGVPFRAALADPVPGPRRPARPHPAGLLGTAAAILYVFLWATAFVPSRLLARAAPPLTILWIRFFLAGGALFVGAWLAGLRIPGDRETWLRLLLLGTGGNALYLGLNYEALRHLSAGMGSIVASTNPLLLALLAPWLLREPLT